MRAVIYVRVSTDSQEQDGTSLDTQRQECLSYAERLGWDVVEQVPDVVSGFTLDRSGLDRVRELVRCGKEDVVLAYAVDRLSRNQNHIGILLEDFEQAQVKLDFVTENFEETAIGKLLIQVRTFAAELEREKIAERTKRGKAQRAREGQLPQGTGKGFYGYTYDKEAKRRKVNDYQAAVVQRIFQRYSETRSLSAVSGELNDAAIPAFSGGRWYPITIWRLLINESYTGRTIYRRTRRVAVRQVNGTGPRSRVEKRPSDEWIEIEGFTPRIIDEPLWQRVQDIIADPERIARKPSGRFYALGGRIKCGLCGSAMVGQTMKGRGYEYKYYRCRHAYDKNTGHECAAKYVRSDLIENAVWSEIRKVLSKPHIVLAELRRQGNRNMDEAEIKRLETSLNGLTERENRLIHLYTLGEFTVDMLLSKKREIAAERTVLDEQLEKLMVFAVPSYDELDSKSIKSICRAVAKWLRRANQQEQTLVLEAMQIEVKATKEKITVSGVLPAETPSSISETQPSSYEQGNPSSPQSGLSFHFSSDLVVARD